MSGGLSAYLSRNDPTSRAWRLATLTITAALSFAAQVDAETPLSPTSLEGGRGPIIDMHLHAFGWDEFGDPPPPNEISGELPASRSDEEAIAATLREMKRHGVVLGVASGPMDQVAQWRQAAGESLLGGAYTGPRDALPEASALRELFERGELAVLGELGLQYRGLSAADESLGEYFALAEELDIPVAIHTGLGDAGTPYGCCPKFGYRHGHRRRRPRCGLSQDRGYQDVLLEESLSYHS